MRGLARFVLSTALVISAAAITPAPLAAQQNCGALQTTFVVLVPGTEATSSQTFEPITSAVVTPPGASCVHVQFAAEFRSRTPKSVQLRATVDDVPAGFPNVVNVSTSAAAYDERSVTFIIPSVASSVTVGVEMRSADGTPVQLRNGILRVQYMN